MLFIRDNKLNVKYIIYFIINIYIGRTSCTAVRNKAFGWTRKTLGTQYTYNIHVNINYIYMERFYEHITFTARMRGSFYYYEEKSHHYIISDMISQLHNRTV